MRKSLKKVTSLLLASAVVLSGCSTSSTSTQVKDSTIADNTKSVNEATVESNVEVTEAVESVVNDDPITVVLMDKGRCSAEEGNMANNRWTEYINENSGVNVEFIPVVRDNFEENLNMLLASGTIPDIIFTYEATYVQQLIDQGLIQPIDGLLEQYSDDCKSYLEENPDLVNYLTFDGELYAMSNKRSSIIDQGMWIRQDWLDAVGMDIPTNEEEFLNVCRAFNEAKLGGDDTVALSTMTYLWDYFSPMYAAHDLWYVNEDGKVEYGILTDRFASATSLLRTCYEEGLISKEFATDTDSAIATQNWVAGNSGILLYKASPVLMKELLENDPEANPIPLAPFETSFGNNALHHSEMNSGFVMISSQCENPEATVKYLDWLLSDGWFTLSNGLEGIHYTLTDNGYPMAIESDEVNQQMRYSSAYILLAKDEITEESILASAAQDEMSQKIAQLEVDSLKVNSEYNYRRDLPRTPDVPEYGIMYADWSLLERQLMIKGITGGEDYSIDDMMLDLEKEWNALGGDVVIEKVQEWYDTYHKDTE